MEDVVKVDIQLPVKGYDGEALSDASTVTVDEVYSLLKEVSSMKDLKGVVKSYKKQSETSELLTFKRFITSAISTMSGDAAIKPVDKIRAYRIVQKMETQSPVEFTRSDVKLIMRYAIELYNPLICGRLDEFFKGE